MWKVHIPSPRFMSGVQSFSTCRAATKFMHDWNFAEIKAGGAPVIFVRDGKTWKAEEKNLDSQPSLF